MEMISRNEITATQLARKLTEYLNRVAYRGESFVIMRGKKPVAELKPLRAAGTMVDLVELSKARSSIDSDEREAFARDLEEVQRLGNEPLVSPWDEP